VLQCVLQRALQRVVCVAEYVEMCLCRRKAIPVFVCRSMLQCVLQSAVCVAVCVAACVVCVAVHVAVCLRCRASLCVLIHVCIYI